MWTPLKIAKIKGEGVLGWCQYDLRCKLNLRSRCVQVHVFDWDGTLRFIVELEVVAASIAVDMDASRLYAVEHDPVPVIVEYDLSETDLGNAPLRGV